MEIERGVNPNCSELIIRLNTTDMDYVKEELKKIGIEEVVVKNYYDWNRSTDLGQWDDPDNQRIIKTRDLPEEALELMDGINIGTLSGKNYEKAKKKLKEKHGIDEGSDSVMLSNGESHPDLKDHSSVRLSTFDNDTISIMAHQHCQWQLFPILKKIADHFAEEVYGFDGGSSDEYESWEAGEA